MNLNNLGDLPDWDELFIPFIEADKNGEERPTSKTCKAAQALFAQWHEIMYMIRGSFDIEDEDFKMVEMELLSEDIEDLNAEESEIVRKKFMKRAKVQVIIDSYEVGKNILRAESEGLYIERMEKAVIIRKIVITIDNFICGLMLEKKSVFDASYGFLIREEIDKFRILFKNWVSTFEMGKDDIDEWGLFI
jgi:hypothetical protein